jgi:cardiolipin synthase
LIAPFTAAFLMDAAWNMSAAFVIFVIAALTDFFDGWVARRRNETSALGAALDPIADKLLIAAALLLLTRNGVIRDAGVIAALLIILREIFVAGLREATAQRAITLSVTTLAKWKTTSQLVAVGFLLAAAPGGLAGESLRPFAAGLLWLSAVLTLWTGAVYAWKAFGALRGAPR